MTDEFRKMMHFVSARIYAGISVVFLVMYTTLALHEHLSGDDQWTLYYLVLGFGLFLVFFLVSGRTMKKALRGT
ncbi:MAG: hypothetical protein HXS44_15780 [Theionarchaea archaeon]|nr:hypothetical protein [Theionarchaea archaeon]